MLEVQNRRAHELLSLYSQVRADTERLCQPLVVEDYIPQPVTEASPPKWNIAHTTWFFEEMILKPFVPDYRVFHPQFGFLFNSYYNSVGARTPRDQRSLARPTVAEVVAYRQYVDEAMEKLLRSELTDEIAALITLGLQHEQQHQELFLTDLKYSFSRNPLFPAYEAEPVREERCDTGTGGWIEVAGGIYDIGFAGEGFCFDNECARHRVLLEDVVLRDRLVTNAEYLEFMADGGYEDFRLWHAEGWDWVQQHQIKAPLYWQPLDGEWMNYTLAGLRAVQTAAPVCHISFYEAAAFAEWKQMRLPTEFEWEAGADQLAWGLRWEWTNSAYLPYPRFRPAAGAAGEYNGKFMVNQMVLRGASVVTPPQHSRKTYRNFFHPPSRWQFTGIRLAR
ncbi:MAG TPA: ergothioneine biosynthesis protein EgtB [Blastocatellia bacterium]|nr:ergothioneine biosynthesis protein EgtB [Blastocatellia bacterium]